MITIIILAYYHYTPADNIILPSNDRINIEKEKLKKEQKKYFNN